MRDLRYVAVHRGGPLGLVEHRLLAIWSAACAERVLTLFSELKPEDFRPEQALETARAWANGEVPVGAAQRASLAAHAAARTVDGPARYAARAAGQAVATAHMADHAPGGAWYALKAIQASFSKSERAERLIALEREYLWQRAQLPEQIRDLVESTFAGKFAKQLKSMGLSSLEL